MFRLDSHEFSDLTVEHNEIRITSDAQDVLLQLPSFISQFPDLRQQNSNFTRQGLGEVVHISV